jgi:hypothetical protein
MKISIRDLLWLTALVAILLAWWLQWQSIQRERTKMNATTLQMLTQQYVAQEAEVTRLAAKVSALQATENPGEASLQLEFAQTDLQRAKAFRDAIKARIAKRSDEATALDK